MKSVRFWKRAIVIGVILLIVIPTTGMLLLAMQNSRLKREIEALPLPGDDAISMGSNSYDAASIVRKRPLLSYQLLFPELAGNFSGFNDDLVDPKTVFFNIR